MSTDLKTDIKTLVMDWTEAMNQHDPDAYTSFMADNCVFTNVGTGQRLVGPAAIRADIANLFAAWSDLHIEKTSILVAGDSFATEWIITGVHAGDLPGLPATGRAFRLLGAGSGRVRNGKFVSLTEYWNQADFLRQIGVLPSAAD